MGRKGALCSLPSSETQCSPPSGTLEFSSESSGPQTGENYVEEIPFSPASAWRCHTSLTLIAYWGGQYLRRRKDAESIVYLRGREIKT